MRTIERSTAFKRDYKRIKATPRHRKQLDTLLSEVLNQLVDDKLLASKFRDRALSGNWYGYRECHLKPDLLLIYRGLGKKTLQLMRLGPHSELFN